jgi:acyl carrier protein
LKHDLKSKIDLRENVILKISEILINGLKLNKTIEEMDPDTPLFVTGFGLDSVDAVVIIVELESKFNITIEEDEGQLALRTINSLVDLVLEKIRNGAG